MLRARTTKLGWCIEPVVHSELTVLFSQILVLLPWLSLAQPSFHRVGTVDQEERGGGGGEEVDDSFPSLSPGSQAFSLTAVASVASSSVSTFLSFIFTRRASISWLTEGICRGEYGGQRVREMGKTYKLTSTRKVKILTLGTFLKNILSV